MLLPLVDDRRTREMPPGLAATHVEVDATPVAVAVGLDQVETSTTAAAVVETGQSAADEDAMLGGGMSAADVVAKDDRPVDEGKESTDASATRSQRESLLLYNVNSFVRGGQKSAALYFCPYVHQLLTG